MLDVLRCDNTLTLTLTLTLPSPSPPPGLLLGLNNAVCRQWRCAKQQMSTQHRPVLLAKEQLQQSRRHSTWKLRANLPTLLLLHCKLIGLPWKRKIYAVERE